MTQAADHSPVLPQQPKAPPTIAPARRSRIDVKGFINPLMSQASVERRARSANRTLQLQLDIAERERILQDLSDGPEGIKPVIAKVNQKGGCGKTTDTSSGSIVTGHVTGQTIIVVDGNQARGNTKSRMVEQKTLPIRKAMATLGTNFSHNDVTRHLGHHPKYRNVYVIDSDNADARAGRPITVDEYYPFVVNLEAESSAVVYDCGNEMDSVQFLVAISHAHVLCFVAVPWVANAVEDCRDTMDHIRKAYPEKVANSVITLTGCYENDMNAQYWADFFKHPADQIAFIPFDPAFEAQSNARPDSPERKVWITDHAEFQLTTYLANLDREILTFKQARKGLELAKEKPETLSQKIDKIKRIVQAKAAMVPAPIAPPSLPAASKQVEIEATARQLIELTGSSDSAGIAIYKAYQSSS